MFNLKLMLIIIKKTSITKSKSPFAQPSPFKNVGEGTTRGKLKKYAI